ncbi:alpha-glucan family phosphorylase [Arthrobacter castelli]|uniref:alpha-glucan family phosphorylase n=1 Tax=Arthrobacter castelli TaxID=271431 RepID=UPI0004146572|nr:alpha-glucan family phosphorylase [Arthrobacter castelli]
MKAIRRFSVRTVLPDALEPLGRLAANLRWSWHQRTLRLFEELDPQLWQQSRRDPASFLGIISAERLQQLAADPDVVSRVQQLGADLDNYLAEPKWYQSLGSDAPASIAYFSPEFGITSALPQYSGGLGILAGDHLKAASDLGVPLIGVGLLYQSGYFRQWLSRDAWQQESYPVLHRDEVPLSLLRESDGTPAQVQLPLPDGRQLLARVWRADVGRVPLLLLDSNVPDNDQAARGVTDRLYGGGGEHRLQQELLLGMGGVKALRIFERLTGTPAPEVFHTNEGHAGFLGVERIRELMHAPEPLSWDEALMATRAGTVFTTHTPVPAGIDRFERDQIAHFFNAGLAPGVPVDSILALGHESYEGGDPSVFNMAVMGLRLAQRANGVAKLHGEVSRSMFAGLWPGFDQAEVPIGSITNGVHVPTWVDPQIAQLAKEQFGAASILDPEWTRAHDVDDATIWQLRRNLRSQLIEDVRRRVRAAWKERGLTDAELSWTDSVLDPDVLTIGFARRVPTYKRLTLMLRDPQRLKALLLHPTHPIQLVIAGKSHPADEEGKRMIQDLVRFTDDPEVRHRIVFLPNYDIAMARTLFPGCDVWLNNPLRPLEACGTSGMKAAINGGLNLSVLDGWWDEMYDGDNGWAIPTADRSSADAGRPLTGPEAEHRDDVESAALYDLLEHTVAPTFYGPGGTGSGTVPAEWAAMIKHTLATLGPAVSAERMVAEYVQTLYRPAGAADRGIRAADYGAARELASYADRVRACWDSVVVEHVDSAGVDDSPRIGDTMTVTGYVDLGGLAPEDVCVEAAYGRLSGSDELADATLQPMAVSQDLGSGRYSYTADITIGQPGAFGYTVRIFPSHEGLASKAELGLVAEA